MSAGAPDVAGKAAPATGDLASDGATGARAVAVLRLLLLPIVFAGDRLVAHPIVGTRQFDIVFAVACLYAAVVALFAWWRGPRIPTTIVLSCDLLLVAALANRSGGAFSQLRAAFLAIPLAAALLVSARRTAAIAVATVILYLLVALTHPAIDGTVRVDVAFAHTLYVVWVGVAAFVLSSLLERREQRIATLASMRGQLLAQALGAEQRARKRLSDDLHDHAIQNVLTARQDVSDALAGDPAALGRAEHALRLALRQLRSAVRELHPYLLDHVGLEHALEAIAEQHASRGRCRIRLDIDPAAVGLHNDLLAALGSELIGNAAKHAQARNVTVRLGRQDGGVVLDVADDGRGFTPEEHRTALREGHIGLASSRERVEAAGGSFQISSTPGAGARITCFIPLRAPAWPTDRKTSGWGRFHTMLL